MPSIQDVSRADDKSAFDLDEARSVLDSLPRRTRINLGASKASTLSLPPKRGFDTSILRVCARILAWSSRLLVYFAYNAIQNIVGKRVPEERAVRLRELLQSMGPTAIKVGQQLSVRADLLPAQYCDELSKMLDQVPPFEIDHAIATVEKAIGKPLSEVFETFDPEPIGSASLACVYQAKLHSGELVAVKVKRPQIALHMATDLKAICWLCNIAEMIGFIRAGLTTNFQLELTRMLSEELDFTLEGRYTTIFRRDAKKFKHVSAPRVYHDLSNFDVLVTEFVAGVFLTEMLYALERKDQKSLNDLLSRGFRPETIARRMLHIFWWECFESNFFHADPHPANIIVRPDNTLVLIDFGSCGAVSSRMRRQLLTFNRFMVQDDINAMVRTTIAMLEPLPHFDVETFSVELMSIYREGFIAHKSKSAPWYDKCSGGMWMKVIMLSQKYNLPMTLDTVRIFRANFLYDSIVYRLHADLDPQKEFKDWAGRLDRKYKRRALKKMIRRVPGPLDSDFTRAEELNTLLEHAMHRFQHFLDQPSYNFGLTIGKMAYVFTLLLRSSVIVVGLSFFLSVGRVLWMNVLGQSPITGQQLARGIEWTFNNKIFIFAMTVYAMIIIRKLLFKLQDVETRK